MSDKIMDVLEKLWIDCNNIPTDGTIYDPIGVLTEQAHSTILKIFKEMLNELEKKYDQLDMVEERRKVIYNQALQDIRAKIEEPKG